MGSRYERWMLAGLTAMGLWGQPAHQEQPPPLRANTRLVVLPASVSDKQGHPVEGLSPSDFVVLDNGNPRTAQVDTEDSGLAPIALITLVQTSGVSLSALAKIRKVGTMIPDAVAGANGESAVIGFDEDVNLLQDFTPSADKISRAFEKLKPAGNRGGRMLDAVEESLHMLAQRKPGTRAIIVIIGESRDRGSRAKLADVLAKVEQTSVAIYSLTYSAYLTPFTTKADEYTPPEGGGLLLAITETARLAKANTVKALANATGGSQLLFQTKSKLENDLIRLGGEIHRRYYLSFTPNGDDPPGYHRLEVRIKDHPDAIVKTRSGYWAVR